MRILLAITCFLLFTNSTFGNHLKGGWIQYEFLSSNLTTNTNKYKITVRQYLDCNSTSGQRDANVFLGIFDGATNTLITTLTIARAGFDNPNKTSYSACISSPPIVCYYIDRYEATVDLPFNPNGYTLAVQRCCRIAGIVNVSGNSSTIGISYTNKIPGTINGVDYSNNSSPVFAQKDTAIVCYSSPFSFDFSATDIDGDIINYSFCDGLIGGNGTSGGAQPNPPNNPPYAGVPYSTVFSGSSPMGSTVTIDPKTGIISGIAPSITGDYIVAVCASEYRNNVLIGVTKKEIHIKVANCSISAAVLKPSYISCNGTTLSFQNESPNATITSYLWDFGVPGLTNDTSTNPTPTYDFLKSGKDSGTFFVKLVVSSSGGCKDSATTKVSIYPGFKPDFNFIGTCYLNPYLFKDATTTTYGVVNSWKWNFGDNTVTSDTALSKDSAWTYPAPVNTSVTLIVSNSKGCIDTIVKPLVIVDKPTIALAFKDTLICSIDSLLLNANISGGTINWTVANGPNKLRIINSTSPTPLVFPRDTTTYYVSINNNGCTNNDSVTVNVLKFISVKAGPDTGICKTDPLILNPISDALSYLWTASTGEIVQAVRNPTVKPLSNTRYFVLANLGKCQAKDSLLVKVSDYPTVVLGNDTAICFGNRLQLNAKITGDIFNWTPTVSLINEKTLSPLAGPSKTTTYIISVRDTTGCKKQVSDTLVVTVVPPINAYAGRDTTILPDQSLQLNASGGNNYLWSPPTGLSAIDIPNPIVLLNGNIDSVVYTVTVFNGGCQAKDQVVVRIYKTGPDIIVPDAFTPNGDGKNDLARPVTIGITKLNYFTIYNRWGQPVFTTSEFGKGWDGIYNGTPQSGGTYVFKAEGIDISGKAVFRKGTLILIR